MRQAEAAPDTEHSTPLYTSDITRATIRSKPSLSQHTGGLQYSLGKVLLCSSLTHKRGLPEAFRTLSAVNWVELDLQSIGTSLDLHVQLIQATMI